MNQAKINSGLRVQSQATETTTNRKHSRYNRGDIAHRPAFTAYPRIVLSVDY
jgi:hypothetical protein